VRDDIGRYGETYERAAWRLGFYTVCPGHHAILVTACPGCSCYQVSFRRWAGRQRLICDFCRGPVEAADATATAKQQAGEVATSYDVALATAAFALQADLLRAAAAAPPTSLCWPAVPASSYAPIVRTLAALLLRPRWHDARSSCSEEEIGRTHYRGLADLPPRTAHEVLGRIASILAAAADAAPGSTGEVRRTEQGVPPGATDLAGLSGGSLPTNKGPCARQRPIGGRHWHTPSRRQCRRNGPTGAVLPLRLSTPARNGLGPAVLPSDTWREARQRTAARIARRRAAAATQPRELLVGVSGRAAP